VICLLAVLTPSVAAATSTQTVTGPESGSCGADVPALGAPIDTVLGRDGSVMVGGKEYASGRPWFHVVVVNRCTLDVSAYRYDDNGEELPAIKAQLDKLDAKSIVIVAAPLGLALSYTRADDLNRDILRPIGATTIPIDALERPFSVIGVPGWSVGAAYQNLDSRLGVPGQTSTEPGSLRGYLQKDIATQAFNFVFPDFVRAATRTASTPTSNTMTIGSTTVPGTLPPDRSGGFQLVVLDGRSLDLVSNSVFATNGGGPADESQQQSLGEALQAVDVNQIALLQSIGTPTPTTVRWNSISDGIDRLGGIRTIVNQLGGQSYALLASPAWKSAAKESITDEPSQQLGAVGSLLSRESNGMFQPLLTDPTGATSGNELLEVAYQPTTKWPLRNEPSDLAAIKYIANALALKVDDPRLRYTDLGIAFSDAQYLGKLQVMTYPGGPDFSQADFDAVKAQLENEFGWVSKTRSYIDRLMQVMTQSVITDSATLNQTTRRIRNEVSDSPVEMNPYEVLSILSKMSGLAAEHALAEPELAGALAFISGAFALAAVATKGQKGESQLAVFTASKDQLSDELATRFRNTLKQLGQLRSILVTDGAKLRTAGTGIEDGKPGWQLTDDTIAVAQRSEEIAAQQLYASTLLRVPYVTYRLPDAYQTAADCRVLGPNQPRSAWMSYVSGFVQQGAQLGRQTTAWAVGTDREDDRAGHMVARADLIDPLFEPVSPDFSGTGLGLYKPRFLATNFSIRDLPKVNCATR